MRAAEETRNARYVRIGNMAQSVNGYKKLGDLMDGISGGEGQGYYQRGRHYSVAYCNILSVSSWANVGGGRDAATAYWALLSAKLRF